MPFTGTEEWRHPCIWKWSTSVTIPCTITPPPLRITIPARRSPTMMWWWSAGMTIIRRRISPFARRRTGPTSARTAGARNSEITDISMCPMRTGISATNPSFIHGWRMRTTFSTSTSRICLAGWESWDSARRTRILQIVTCRSGMRRWRRSPSMPPGRGQHFPCSMFRR